MTTRRRKPRKDTITASGEPPPGWSESEPSEPVSDPATKVDPIGIAWGNIVRDSLQIADPAKLAKRLREELELGEGARTQYGAVLAALDRSASNLDAAGRLARAAKVQEEAYKLKVGERLEVLRSKSLEQLMVEYKAKERPSPTAAAIEDRILANWGIEYRTIMGRISELHAAVRSLETLRDAWASRSADLRIIADKARRPV